MLPTLAIVAEINPHIEGQGYPPNVILRAINKRLSNIVKHSIAVDPVKWHHQQAASKSN